MCLDNGRPTIDIRLAIGALIVKHKMKLSDRDVVAMIQENIYIQYFVGFSSFNPEASFDPSLFPDTACAGQALCGASCGDAKADGRGEV